MKYSLAIRPLTLALLACGSVSSHAVSFTQGDITLDINGTVNGYYVNREAKTTTAAGVTTTSNNSALSNGLLPGWINFVATTKADGNDIKAHISFAPGINNNSQVIGLPIGNNAAGVGATNPYSQIDTRNLYFQFGNNDWGTLKFGRDIGLFGQNVILSDMTLIGVGGTSNAGIPYNTTFGMIGHGYMYTGFQPQITYTTPNKGGAATGKLWTGMVTQSTSCSTGCTAGNQSFSANGFELGGKARIGNFEAVAYGFTGKGLGLSTVGAQFYNGSNGNGNKTDSKGYFLQGTYTLGKTKLGVNYGENRDKDGFALTGAGASSQIKNKAYTLGAYHSLNKYVTLVGEVNEERISNVADTGNNQKNRTLSFGGIIFF
jgi:predicted porin